MFRICIVILFLCLSSQALAKPPVFLTSQKEAQKVSEDLGFPVLTIVSATWCGPCKQLHNQISTNLYKRTSMHNTIYHILSNTCPVVHMFKALLTFLFVS